MALIIDYEYQGYSFNEAPKGGGHSIYVRVKGDPSWNTSAYSKKVHKGSKDEDLDWNQIWYNKKGSSTYSTKNVKLTKTNKDDHLKSFETYFPSEPKTGKILVLGFVTNGGVKTYVTRTELKLDDESQLEFSVKQEGKNEFLAKLYKENYTINKVLSIKIDAISSYHNVDVKKGEPISGTDEFHKYNHTPSSNAKSHDKSVLDCSSKCQFKSFDAKDYSNTKLKEVAVYFHNSDSYQRVPLLIELEPNSSQSFGRNNNGQKLYYKLESVYINKSEDNPEKWTKIYNKTSDTVNVTSTLNGIYNGDLKEKIDKILGIGNSTVIKAVSGSVGTISAIGTGVGGFFLYKNSAIVITFIKSLF